MLVHGAGGSVRTFAVQLARDAGLHVVATASAADAAFVRGLGAENVLDYRAARFEENLEPVDIVIDTQGGEARERSLRVLKDNGMLVSAASLIPDEMARRSIVDSDLPRRTVRPARQIRLQPFRGSTG